jgi:hypothetical protein
MDMGSVMIAKKNRVEKIRRVNALVTATWVRRLDEWRRHQPDLPTTSESIRRLVEIGIDSQKPPGKKRDA